MGKRLLQLAQSKKYFHLYGPWKIPGDLEEDTESLKMIAMDEQDNLIDATALMDGFKNYAYNEDLDLLIRKHWNILQSFL